MDSSSIVGIVAVCALIVANGFFVAGEFAGSVAKNLKRMLRT